MCIIKLKTISKYIYSQLHGYIPHVLYTGNAVDNTELGIIGSSNVQHGKGKTKSYYSLVQILVTRQTTCTYIPATNKGRKRMGVWPIKHAWERWNHRFIGASHRII
jgi:hypothetical protein